MTDFNDQAPPRIRGAALKTAFMFSSLALAATSMLPAQTFTTIASFDNTNGGGPFCGGGSALVQGIDGELYGTTQVGGAYSLGSVYKVSLQGAITTLHSFHKADGGSPCAGLLLASNGNFYGVTSTGGSNGYGTVFELTRRGALTTLHSFNNTDGSSPVTTLMQASSGIIYGSTEYGGAANADCSSMGCGTVFSLTPAGQFQLLHSFRSDEGTSDSPLIESASGNLYGTTHQNDVNGGIIFQITPAGALTAVVTFRGYNGESPNALTLAANGSIYGTTNSITENPGPFEGGGSIFDLGQGKFQTLFVFCTEISCLDDPPNGASPITGLVQGTDSNFYGTTSAGGPYKSGTIFQFSPSGAFTTLFSFNAGQTDSSGLIQATDGNFYGTNYVGGLIEPGCSGEGCGEVFQLSLGLLPFVKTLPSSGPTGSTVRILGTNLTGATSVTFNGVAATFSVAAPTEIVATVPAGATSGTIVVITPTANLESNVVFQVR